MKNIVLHHKIICSLLIAVLSSVGLSAQDQDKKATHHYVSKHCLNFEVPNDWNVNEDYEGMLLHISAPNLTESLPENVNVVSEFIGGTNPNESFNNFMIQARGLLNAHSPDHQMIDVSVEQLEHYQAYTWIYTTVTDNIALKIKQYFVYIGGTVYTITFMANQIEYKLVDDEALAMIHSFWVDVQ